MLCSFANLIIFHPSYISLKSMDPQKKGHGKVEEKKHATLGVSSVSSNSSSSKMVPPSSNSSTPLSIGWALPLLCCTGVIGVVIARCFLFWNPQNSEKVPKKNPHKKIPFFETPAWKKSSDRQGHFKACASSRFCRSTFIRLISLIPPQLRWSFAAVSG